MSDPKAVLPISSQVSVPALARAFNSTTTSYKYLFLLSLLKLYEKSNFSCQRFNLFDIAHQMLVLAWYPHTYFKLSFGLQDKIGRMIDEFKINSNDVISEKSLKELIPSDPQTLKAVLQYVPFRLLSVFFENELTGLNDSQKNRIIKRLASEQFNTNVPLYRFTNKDNEIEIHPAWEKYFVNNYAIIEGWLLWRWQNYLQDKNPNVPAITKKLFFPESRSSLAGQTKFWRTVMAVDPITCIYSGTALLPKEISLDHFLPWSFLGHNQLWNLTPTQKVVNSTKGNRLPSLEQYFYQFVTQQLQAITTSKKILKQQSWENKMECYIVDLQIDNFDSLCEE